MPKKSERPQRPKPALAGGTERETAIYPSAASDPECDAFMRSITCCMSKVLTPS
jgi:hypothetical protein